MTLKDGLLRVSEAPDRYTIRFWYRSGGYDDILFPATVNIVRLCEDWYSDCDYCPENGEFVYGVTFTNDSTGQTFMPEVEKPFELNENKRLEFFYERYY
jgi:hypothetical protein